MQKESLVIQRQKYNIVILAAAVILLTCILTWHVVLRLLFSCHLQYNIEMCCFLFLFCVICSFEGDSCINIIFPVVVYLYCLVSLSVPVNQPSFSLLLSFTADHSKQKSHESQELTELSCHHHYIHDDALLFLFLSLSLPAIYLCNTHYTTKTTSQTS